MRTEYEAWFADKFGQQPMPLDSPQIDFCWHGYRAGVESLRQQLAAALAACKLRDAGLTKCVELHALDSEGKPMLRWFSEQEVRDVMVLAKEVMAIQPDDSALKAWLGEPLLCREDGRCQYAIDHGAEGMSHCPEGKCCMPRYSPKGLK